MAVRERLADASEIQTYQGQTARQPVVSGLKQQVQYVAPVEFAKQKEQKEGLIRGWELYGLDGRVNQAKHNAHTEHVKAETARLGFIGAGMDMMVAQQGVVASGLKWQTLRVQNETARVGLKTAQLDLRGAIAELPLHHQAISIRLQTLQMDCVAGLQQIAIKREPLSISGALRDAKLPALRFPTTITIPTPDGVDVSAA